MNAFFGYITLQDSHTLSEKNKHFTQAVYTGFPGRFPNKKNISYNNLFITGDFQSFYTGNENDANGQALFFHGEIYNTGEIENILGISSATNNNASLIYELIRKKGKESVQMINGQFLIIYVDQQQQKVYIFNDQMGIRQLFYYQDKNILLFGSEIKFLLTHPDCPKEIDWETSLKRPNPDNLYCFRSYKTWFKEINLLPEAYVIEAGIKEKTVKTATYWDWERKQGNYNYSEDRRTAGTVMEEYIALLEDAIKIRTGKEVINCSLLSGGLDSSAIVALCAKHGPAKTFSIITQTTFLENTTKICYDLANDLGIKNSQFLIPMHQIVFNTELWKQWIWRMESPVNHTDSLTKTLLHYAIKKNDPEVKAVLTGTGSDQFNGGLARYILRITGNPNENWESFYQQVKDIEDQKLISRTDVHLWDCKNFINRDYIASLSPKGQEIENNYWMFYVKGSLHSEVFSLCWDEIRASNYHGHETRFPFLDFRFMEFFSKIPPRLHRDLFFDKPILRTPLKNILPEYILNKPKAPYNLPDYNYDIELFKFLTGDKKFIEYALGNIDEAHPVINKAAIREKIRQMQEHPNRLDWESIMHIINLCLLEKMAGKTEKDMDIESFIQPPVAVDFTDDKKAMVFLKTALSIHNDELDMGKPVSFCENCSFLFDKLSNKFFLSKKNELVYEIEEEYKEWKAFLSCIDNQKTIQQILDDLSISYTIIEEFLKIAVEEKIIRLIG